MSFKTYYHTLRTVIHSATYFYNIKLNIIKIERLVNKYVQNFQLIPQIMRFRWPWTWPWKNLEGVSILIWNILLLWMDRITHDINITWNCGQTDVNMWKNSCFCRFLPPVTLTLTLTFINILNAYCKILTVWYCAIYLYR